MPRIELDRVGAVASFACAVHCAVLPVAISLSATGVVSIFHQEAVEMGVVALAAVIGSVAAWRGYRRHGNRTVALVLASSSIVLLVGGLVRPHDEGHHEPGHVLTWLYPVVGLTIAVSHVVNLRLVHACKACGAPGHEGHAHAARPEPAAAPPVAAERG